MFRIKGQNIAIRPAKIEDIDILLQIERTAWQEKAATREMIISRIKTFPEGIFCAIKKGIIQGFAVNEIIDLNKYNTLDWVTLTDNGYIQKSHDYNGDILFGVSISILPNADDKNIALTLYEHGGKLVIQYGLKKAYIGSRIPSYYKYSDKMSVEEYVSAKTKTGRILDPELALYLKIGLKIEKIIPNYFNDPESLNYGVLVSWRNPFYPFTKYSKILAKLIANIFRL